MDALAAWGLSITSNAAHHDGAEVERFLSLAALCHFTQGSSASPAELVSVVQVASIVAEVLAGSANPEGHQHLSYLPKVLQQVQKSINRLAGRRNTPPAGLFNQMLKSTRKCTSNLAGSTEAYHTSSSIKQLVLCALQQQPAILLLDKAAAVGGPAMALDRLEGSLIIPVTPAHALDLILDITGQLPAAQGLSLHLDRVTDAATAVLALALAPQVTGGWHKASDGLQQADHLLTWACRQLERTLSPLLEDLDSHDDGQPSNGNDTVIELPLPVGVHAASLLAARMSQLLLAAREQGGPGSPWGQYAGWKHACNLLLRIIEEAVEAASDVVAGDQLHRQCLGIATAAVQGLQPLLIELAGLGLVPADTLPRLQAVLLSSAAACVPAPAGPEGSTAPLAPSTGHFWMWDLEEKDVWLQPSISGAGAASLAYASALALCRALAEAVAQALAAAWHGGMQSAARFGLLPLVTADASAPGSSAAALEKQALVLTMGRLAALLEGDAAFAQLALPGLLDAQAPAAAVQLHACAAHVLAALTGFCGRSGTMIPFRQALDALVKFYKVATVRHTASSGNAGAYSQKHSQDMQLAIADAFQLTARVMSTADEPMRRQLHEAVLALLCDCLAAGEAPSRAGALLPAAAASGQGLQQHARSVLAAHRSSTDALQQLLRSKADMCKTYRLLWVYLTTTNLARPPSMPARSDYDSSAIPLSWQYSIGTLAAQCTPLAVVGGGQLPHEQIEAELGPPMRRLGKAGNGPRLAGELVSAIGSLQGLGAAPAKGLIAPSNSPGWAAHLLATLTLNLAMVELAPLDEDPSSPSPLLPLLAAQQLAKQGSSDAAWLAAITDAVFHGYCSRLCNSAGEAADQESRLPSQLSLSRGLLEHISQGGQAAVRGQADRLLGSLLVRAPGLSFEPAMIEILLQALAAEDKLQTAVLSSDAQSAVLPRLRQVILTAAEMAPSFTEALLHQHIGGADCELGGNDPAAKHAAQLLGTLNLAATASKLTSPDYPARGMQGLNQKARAMGAIEEPVERETEDAGAGIVGQVHEQLERALASGASEAVLQHRLLTAAAVIVQYPQSRRASSVLNTLTHGAVRELTHTGVRMAAFAWHWVAACCPPLQVQLLAEVVDAWLTSLDRQEGLFCQHDIPSLSDTEVGDPTAETPGDTWTVTDGQTLTQAVSDEGSLPSLLAQHVRAQAVWLHFFWELWQVAQNKPGSAGEAMRSLYARVLLQTLGAPLTCHPCAAGLRARLLLLALSFAKGQPPHAAELLLDRILSTALDWFRQPTGWFTHGSPWQAEEEARALQELAQAISRHAAWPERASGLQVSMPRSTSGRARSEATITGGKMPRYRHPVWNFGSATNAQRVALLQVLLAGEAERLQVWAKPLDVPASHGAFHAHISGQQWQAHTQVAWDFDPLLALSLQQRFPSVGAIQKQLRALANAHASSSSLQRLPGAFPWLSFGASASLPDAALRFWAPATLLQALQLMSGDLGQHAAVKAYALRSLLTCPPEQVAFFLPQLVQLLRGDATGVMRQFLLKAAALSTYFSHVLICTLRAEGTPGDEAFHPAVKRSGWQPPKDTGLWSIADSLKDQVWSQLPADMVQFLKAEIDFFDEVTNISGQLYSVPKAERKAAAVRLAREMALPRADLYLPIDSRLQVQAIIPESATPMQSAAKVPILVAFKVAAKPAGASDDEPPVEGVQACLFKVGDDCRQDVLALQVISLLKDAWEKAGLDLYLAPYGVLPTAYECGIIEIVPNCDSRSALGDTADGGLADIWRREFGAPGTARHEDARLNFIRSEAGYAVACFLLQAKDRHNGNLLLDREGRLVHIDFGFILEISPGGNLGFENAAFKLSHEMSQIIDPSGTRSSPQYLLFQELAVRGYLVARTIAEGILATVALMSGSGLPCYGRGRPIDNLRHRFRLEMSDKQAAAFMRSTINDAYDKWTTGFYDYVQYMQNAIPK